jgi:hypothetical protein
MVSSKNTNAGINARVKKKVNMIFSFLVWLFWFNLDIDNLDIKIIYIKINIL